MLTGYISHFKIRQLRNSDLPFNTERLDYILQSNDSWFLLYKFIRNELRRLQPLLLLEQN